MTPATLYNRINSVTGNNFPLIFLLLLTINVFSQNARLDALGGNFCIDDPSAVSTNPASCLIFYDFVQATAYENGSFGTFAAVKSLGKRFSLGIIANDNEYTDSLFYLNAATFMNNAIDSVSVLSSNFPSYPELILGFNLPIVNIGIKAFYKRSKVQSSTQTADDFFDIKKDIMISGISASGSSHFGIVGIYPFFTYSIPKSQGSYQTKNDTSYQSNTSNNLIAQAGTELGFYIKKLDIRVGGVYELSKYLFTCNNKSAIEQSQINNTQSTVYLGVNAYPRDEVFLSAAYSLTSENNKTTDVSDSINLSGSENTLYHFLAAGCEYELQLKNNRILDKLYIRAGFSWSISNTTYTEHFEDIIYPQQSSDYKQHYASEVSSFAPTIGLGFTKGIVQFDITSKLSGWSGIASGLPVLTGTLTFDFTGLKPKPHIDKYERAPVEYYK